MTRILVVDDEPTIASAVADRLRAEGFTVDVAFDGIAAVDIAAQTRPDLVVLDLMLPGLDGVEVCRRIQAERATPVVMLTARADETDVLVGLGIGADDYVTKPFSPRELVARIKAVLRRASAPVHAHQRIAVCDVVLDPATRKVRKADREVHLTPTEFDLFARMASRPGVVHTREQLLADVWGYRDDSGARTVDSHVAALRRKLGPDLVRTVHGVGYAVEATA